MSPSSLHILLKCLALLKCTHNNPIHLLHVLPGSPRLAGDPHIFPWFWAPKLLHQDPGGRPQGYCQAAVRRPDPQDRPGQLTSIQQPMVYDLGSPKTEALFFVLVAFAELSSLKALFMFGILQSKWEISLSARRWMVLNVYDIKKIKGFFFSTSL